MLKTIFKTAVEIYVRTRWRQAGRASAVRLFMSECPEMFGTYSNTGELLDTRLRAVLDGGFGNKQGRSGGTKRESTVGSPRSCAVVHSNRRAVQFNSIFKETPGEIVVE